MVHFASVIINASLRDVAIVGIYVVRYKALGCTAFANKTHGDWHFHCAESMETHTKKVQLLQGFLTEASI